MEPTTVWRTDREAILQLLDEQSHLAQTIVQSLARRVLQVASLVEDLSERTVEAQLGTEPYVLERSDHSRSRDKSQPVPLARVRPL